MKQNVSKSANSKSKQIANAANVIIQSVCEYIFSFDVREYIHYAPMQLNIPFSKSSRKTGDISHFRVRNVRHFYKMIREKISQFDVRY